MPALGFTYTQGRPCPSFAMLHFGVSNPPFTASSSPAALEAMVSTLASGALNAAGCVESAFELEGTLPLSFFFRSCTVRPEAVLSAASPTLPAVLDLAGCTVFSLPRWFDGT